MDRVQFLVSYLFPTSLISVSIGRVAKDTPRSKRLMTDDQSNILVYMTGHGGEEFLKFQDAEEISAYDLGDAFQQMYEKRRYNEILFMIDTCQANTMYTKIDSPNILATGSSKLKESSYSVRKIVAMAKNMRRYVRLSYVFTQLLTFPYLTHSCVSTTMTLISVLRLSTDSRTTIWRSLKRSTCSPKQQSRTW